MYDDRCAIADFLVVQVRNRSLQHEDLAHLLVADVREYLEREIASFVRLADPFMN